MPTRNLQLISLSILVCLACYVQAQRQRYAGELGNIMQLINRYYVDPVDTEKLYQSAVQGMVSDLDPYSNYITSNQYQQFQSLIEQEFGGLGIIIEGPPEKENLAIVTPLVGTPAYKAGLEPGDKILSINGKKTIDLTIVEASEEMRGPKGSDVALMIQRGEDEPKEYTIRRAAIELESVVGDRRLPDTSWDYQLEQDPRIAYIRITTFGEKTTREVRSALEKVSEKTAAIIIDLRENPGGLLTAAVDISDMFLSSGQIVSTRGRDGNFYSSYEADSEISVDANIPVVLLVNHQSASASEILAACLQDNHRAVVVGERTWGKGTVQNLLEMDGGRSALKLTTARYYRPSGENIHRKEGVGPEEVWGVQPEPTLKVELDEEQTRAVFQRWRRRGDPRSEPMAAGEQSIDGTTDVESSLESLNDDPQLKKAVEYLEEQLIPASEPDSETDGGRNAA